MLSRAVIPSPKEQAALFTARVCLPPPRAWLFADSRVLQVSQELLEALDGKAVPRNAPVPHREQTRAPQEPAVSPATSQPAARTSSEAEQQQRLVQQALAAAALAGEVLLGEEAAVLHRLHLQAEAELARHAGSHSPPLSCAAEREACLACYKVAEGDGAPQRCHLTVEALSRCTARALEEELAH